MSDDILELHFLLERELSITTSCHCGHRADYISAEKLLDKPQEIKCLAKYNPNARDKNCLGGSFSVANDEAKRKIKKAIAIKKRLEEIERELNFYIGVLK